MAGGDVHLRTERLQSVHLSDANLDPIVTLSPGPSSNKERSEKEMDENGARKIRELRGPEDKVMSWPRVISYQWILWTLYGLRWTSLPATLEDLGRFGRFHDLSRSLLPLITGDGGAQATTASELWVEHDQ